MPRSTTCVGRTTCDLLRSITDGVLRDEARHVAFGNRLRGLRHLAAPSRTTARTSRSSPSTPCKRAWRQSNGSRGGEKKRQGGGILGRDPGFLKVLENAEIDPQDLFVGIKAAREEGLQVKPPSDQIHAFKDLMMPALVRVGAVTARSRELFAEANISVFDDTTILESLEDAEDGTILFN